jgi:hypothetical protein
MKFAIANLSLVVLVFVARVLTPKVFTAAVN